MTTWKQGQLLWWGWIWCEIIIGEKAIAVGPLTSLNSVLPGTISKLPQTKSVPTIIEPEEWK